MTPVDGKRFERQDRLQRIVGFCDNFGPCSWVPVFEWCLKELKVGRVFVGQDQEFIVPV